MTRYYKATTKDGRVAVRSTDSKIYARAFIPDSGRRANWASAGYTPAEASRYPGQLVDAVEIEGKEYRQILKAQKEALAS